MTFSRSNPCSQCHTCSLSCQPHLARRRHCQNRQLHLRRRNMRPRNKSSSMMRRLMKTWRWIHSIRCSQRILLYYLYLNINQLLQRILKQAGQEAGLTVKCQRLLPFSVLTLLLIRPESGQRKLLFLNHLHQPDPPSRSSSVAPTEFYSDIAKAHGRVHAQLGDDQDFMFWKNMGKAQSCALAGLH